MRAHIYHTGVKGRLGPHDAKLLSDQGTPIENYTIVVKDLFCAAAADLADDFHIPLDQMGILYDDILDTGKNPQKDGFKGKNKVGDVEKQNLMNNESSVGQLMILTKAVDKKEANRIQNAGFRFAHPEKVIGLIAGSVQINEKLLTERLGMIRCYLSTDRTLDPGVCCLYF